jgi:hypothetical protein
MDLVSGPEWHSAAPLHIWPAIDRAHHHRGIFDSVTDLTSPKVDPTLRLDHHRRLHRVAEQRIRQVCT